VSSAGEAARAAGAASGGERAASGSFSAYFFPKKNLKN